MSPKFGHVCYAATLLSTRLLVPAAAAEKRPGILVGFSPAGQVEELHVGGSPLRLREAGGIWITDVADGQARPLTLSPAPSGLRVGSIESLRLKASLWCTPLSRAVRLDLHIEDTTGRDRALVVEFALPLAADGWTWWEDLRTEHTVAVGQTYYVRSTPSQFGADGRLSIYPLSALCHERAGLCLAVPADAPRDFTIRWAPPRGFSVRFHVATSPDTRRFPRQATASLLLYPCDPAWGFRSALQRYYDLFPSYFERRAKKSGAWLCGSRARAYDTPEAIAALGRRPSDLFGYRLVFGHLAETISEDQAAGLVSIPFNIALAKLRYEGPTATTPAEAQRLLDRVGRPDFGGRFQGFWRGPTSVRNSMLQVLGEDYVRTARAKGLRERYILAKHAFPNALLPLVTAMAMRFGFLIMGAVSVEVVFGYPGMGTLIVEAFSARDYPVLQGAFLFIMLTVLFFNLAAEVLYARLDPRVRRA